MRGSRGSEFLEQAVEFECGRLALSGGTRTEQNETGGATPAELPKQRMRDLTTELRELPAVALVEFNHEFDLGYVHHLVPAPGGGSGQRDHDVAVEQRGNEQRAKVR